MTPPPKPMSVSPPTTGTSAFSSRRQAPRRGRRWRPARPRGAVPPAAHPEPASARPSGGGPASASRPSTLGHVGPLHQTIRRRESPSPVSAQRIVLRYFPAPPCATPTRTRHGSTPDQRGHAAPLGSVLAGHLPGVGQRRRVLGRASSSSPPATIISRRPQPGAGRGDGSDVCPVRPLHRSAAAGLLGRAAESPGASWCSRWGCGGWCRWRRWPPGRRSRCCGRRRWSGRRPRPPPGRSSKATSAPVATAPACAAAIGWFNVVWTPATAVPLLIMPLVRPGGHPGHHRPVRPVQRRRAAGADQAARRARPSTPAEAAQRGGGARIPALLRSAVLAAAAVVPDLVRPGAHPAPPAGRPGQRGARPA